MERDLHLGQLDADDLRILEGRGVLGVVGFLATALYWPGVSGAATVPRWAALFLIVPWLIRGDRIRDATPYLWGGAFFVVAVVSLAWTPQILDGIGLLFWLMILAALFWYGSEIENPRPLYIGASLGVTISSVVALFQWFGFRPVETLGPALFAPAGLFVNPLFLGEAAALLIVAAVAERLWWLLPGLVPALILTQARGATLAAAIALAIHFRGALRWMIAAAIPIGLAGIALYLSTDYGSSERLDIWRSVIHGITPLGHGLGSFWQAYPAFDLRPFALSYPEYAHNEFLHIAFELGLPGIVLAGGFIFSLAGPLTSGRLVLIALLMEMCFAFPSHLPATATIGLILAGYAVRDRYLLRDFVPARRVHFRGWDAGAKPADAETSRAGVSVRSQVSRRRAVARGVAK